MPRSPENEILHKRKVFAEYEGVKFGTLTVVSLVEEQGASKVECLCVCGNRKVTLLSSLKSGNTKSCGCTGELVLNQVYYTKVHNNPYKFLGYEKVFNNRRKVYLSKAKVGFMNTGYTDLFTPSSVREGSIVDKFQPTVADTGYMGRGRFNSKSKCHGKLIYGIWSSMIRRCYDRDDWRYNLYGGRGVVVCEEWCNFQNFSEWFVETLSTLPKEVDYQVDKDLKGFLKTYSPDSCVFIPKCLNVALQMERPCTNRYGVGIRFIEKTGKFCAQVSSARGGKNEKITGRHRNTLEEAVEDYIQLKHEELNRLSSELLEEGLISQDINEHVKNLDIRKMLDNY